MLTWTVLIPVKPADTGKSRLGQSPGTGPDLARAIALDTIAAAVASGARVAVVTADTTTAADAAALGAEVVTEPRAAGLAAAIAAGFAGIAAGHEAPRAVLLGDLPYLHSDDLREALVLAAEHDRAFVPDAEGTGSTLVTAMSGVELISAFGPDSARKHRDAGLVEIVLPATSRLRRDVDLGEHLTGEGLGPRTRAALAS